MRPNTPQEPTSRDKATGEARALATRLADQWQRRWVGRTSMNIEQRLLESVVRKSPDFAEVVDAFVGQLLAEAGYSRRLTDGVLFSWEELQGDGAFGFGLILMIEGQWVEPLRVQLRLNPARRGLASGIVQFGSRDHGDVAYGGSEHHRMARQILGNRSLEFAWREQFHGGPEGWRRLPLNKR
jgi:hypothetical protein